MNFDICNSVRKQINQEMGMGVIICLYDKKLYLRDNLIALPLEYI